MLSSSIKLPKYDNPPVIEVACGLIFHKIEKFKIPHLGQFWNEIKDDFPHCDHATPLVEINNENVDSVTGLPLPRVWFISEGRDQLIQIQNGRFHFNWRKINESETYLSFENINNLFKGLSDKFSRFLDNQKLHPFDIYQCELVYINHVPIKEDWKTLNDLNKVFPGIFLNLYRDTPLSKLANLSASCTIPLPDNMGHLSVKFQKALRKTNSIPIILIEISARGIGEDKTDLGLKNWFNRAHESIVGTFSEITTLEIQKELWGRQ